MAEASINWHKEVENLAKKNNEFWKPESGKYIVEFCSDGNPFTTIDYNDRNKPVTEQKIVEKVLFNIRVNDKEYSWAVTKGKGLTSLYGQIALVAMTKNSLVGSRINVIIKGDGKDRDYTIEEAINLLALQKKHEEKV